MATGGRNIETYQGSEDYHSRGAPGAIIACFVLRFWPFSRLEGRCQGLFLESKILFFLQESVVGLSLILIDTDRKTHHSSSSGDLSLTLSSADMCFLNIE